MAKIRNVGQLVDWLSKLPRDMRIEMLSDAEGNGCSALYSATVEPDMNEEKECVVLCPV